MGEARESGVRGSRTQRVESLRNHKCLEMFRWLAEPTLKSRHDPVSRFPGKEKEIRPRGENILLNFILRSLFKVLWELCLCHKVYSGGGERGGKVRSNLLQHWQIFTTLNSVLRAYFYELLYCSRASYMLAISTGTKARQLKRTFG